MVLYAIVGFVLSCMFLVKSSQFAARSLAAIAKIIKLKEFIISFIVVGVITSLPEASVSIISAIEGDPGIGFGTLVGSNIADLSIVLGLVVLAGGAIRVKSHYVFSETLHIVFGLLPFILAYDGVLSRLDVAALAIVCLGYIFHLIRGKYRFAEFKNHLRERKFLKNSLVFALSIGVLLASASFVVYFTKELAINLSMPAVILALVLVGPGTCLPELMFAIKSMKLRKDELALGDILGNVIVDATLVLGITALISPITLSPNIVLVTGAFTVVLVLMILSMLKRERELSKTDAMLLIFLYIVFILIETILSRIF